MGVTGRFGRAGGTFVALTLVFVVLALPHQRALLTPLSGFWAPVELPLIVLLLAFVPRALRLLVCSVLALLLTLLTLFKLADVIALIAYWRIFDPVADWRLLGPAWDLLSASIGVLPAAALLSGILAGALLLGWLLRCALMRIARHARAALYTHAGRYAWRWAAGLYALWLIMTLAIGHSMPALSPPSPAHSSRLVVAHVHQSWHNLHELAELREAVAQHPDSDRPAEQLFSKLAGKDIVVVFIESYGRTALEDARYAPQIDHRLHEVNRELNRAGFQARSAWVRSPTVGGQSWLAHTTLQTGLWINSQRRYNWIIGSRQVPLTRLFERAGWYTVDVSPAITGDWPAGRWFGFQETLDARNLGYQGQPYNWITMPDQYTYSAFQRLELGRNDRPPLMAMISTVSSHAPWVPVPPMVPWEKVGEGRIFSQWADANDPPSVVWQDSDRVRHQYRKAIDYSLQALGSFVATYGDDDLVVLALGDHQPASIITGDQATREVPVHLMTRDREVLQAFEQWGWSRGMIPDDSAATWRMDEFRQRLIDGFSAARSGSGNESRPNG
ncbi:hypothetical protein [Kushneria phosphatilytica]|uniref:Sulfatase n=1 Tax=Kushneria phosphatilytica TaxID=657387 RepID=A0A1S1NQS8_9GAMM|nr:hypothetical protein [Kushneria phosphatilytica]OHV11149.1 hypothetical protein BH688_07400 [Kushneria phosphatilytica]QEL12284.1 sulfatase [Kushneria phosphatilytica]